MNEQKPKKTIVTLNGCGLSLIGIVLALIVCLWIIFHGSVIWDFLNHLLSLVQGGK